MDFNTRFENCPSILNNWPEVQQHISNFLIRDGTLNCKPIKAKLSELLDSVTEGKNDIIQVLGNTFFFLQIVAMLRYCGPYMDT